MLRVLKAELLKLRGSKAVWGTIAIVASFALMTVSMSSIFTPGAESTTWHDTLAMSPQFMAAWWGLPVFGLAASSLFGSEFSDGTAASMLTVPIRREHFVVAKMVVLALWVVLLALVSVASQALAAVFLGAHGFSWDLVLECVRDSLAVAAMLYLTLPVVALISMVGRGYIAPMLYSTGVTALAMTAGFVGWERWVPWAMQLTVAGGIAPPGMIQETLPAASWVILAALFAGGLAGVFAYMNLVDSP